MSIRLAAYEPDMAPNLGAMIRIAACFGVPIDVIEPCGFPFSIRALKRTAMDYSEIANIAHHDSWDSFRKESPGRVVLLTTKGAVHLNAFAFQPGDILMTGRESAGVPDHIHAAVDARVKVSMPGGGRSLNVGVTAGIALHEAMRQLNAL